MTAAAALPPLRAIVWQPDDADDRFGWNLARARVTVTS
ncbi:hypothetical protein ABIB37_002590 [Agrococcus sp. UYP10]